MPNAVKTNFFWKKGTTETQLCSIILFYFFVRAPSIGGASLPPTPPLPVGLRPPIANTFFCDGIPSDFCLSWGGPSPYWWRHPSRMVFIMGVPPHGRRNILRILSSIGGGRDPPMSDGNFPCGHAKDENTFSRRVMLIVGYDYKTLLRL